MVRGKAPQFTKCKTPWAHGCYIMKKIRAGVSIEGHCVLLKNSPRINFLDFFLNSQIYRMSHIFLDILLTHDKKIVKILETRQQKCLKIDLKKWLNYFFLNFFFKVNLWPKLHYFLIFWDHIFKTVLSLFSVLSSK